MNLLTQCPYCRGEMNEVRKNGVFIDICTQCQGVWLDKGELSVLLENTGSCSSSSKSEFKETYYENNGHSRDSHRHPRKKSGFDRIFELFD